MFYHHLLIIGSSQDLIHLNFNPSDLEFDEETVLGTGTFGVVTKAYLKPHHNLVAIKRVHQDPKYKVCIF